VGKKSRRKSRHRRTAPPHGNGGKPQSSTESAASTSVPTIKSEPSESPEAPISSSTAEAPRGAGLEASASWRDRLFEPIDIASIAFFRICLGLLLLHDMYRFHAFGAIKAFYIDPPYQFAFFGLDFIKPLPGNGMYLLFAVLTVCTVLITIGLFYRVAITVFVIGFTYIFLLDETRYLNHFYFAGLLCFLMIFIPASRGWSVDALIAGRSQDAKVPAWSLWILRVQMEIMLIYAGIVKLDADWLQGEPLGLWLSRSTDVPVIGPFLLNDTVILIGAWGAAFLHLIGAVMLLFKSTRIYAFAVYCLFHFANHLFFNIGIFPWLTIAATTLFFDPDWPKVVWGKITQLLRLPQSLRPAPSSSAGALAWSLPSLPARTAIVSLIVAWTAFQVLLPLRHWLYPGNTGWHQQGYYFAWQMMLRQKFVRGMFYVRDPDTNREWLVDPNKVLTPAQTVFMLMRPEMIRQFAHYLEKEWAKRHGTRDIEVRAFTAVSLNGRGAQALIDPKRDLTKIGYSLAPSDWILPLTEPMPPKGQRWRGDEMKVLVRTMQADPAVRRLLAERQKISSRQKEEEKR
jgi:hypothetical protein